MYQERTIYTTRTEYVPAYETVECRVTPDPSYIQTLDGLLKLLVIVLNLLCFICVAIGGPGYYSGISWVTFTTTFGFTISLLLLFLYLFHVVDMFPQIPWIIGEMVYCFAWTIFYFISASILAVGTASYRGTFGWALAAFFAFAAMCAYGFDCYLKFLAWKRDEKATGRGTSFHPHNRTDNI
ncbi:MARVEL domain-containing protein [Aphelenchoides besseyi]|nr:MARVEL domain-containing protein [Aphelenchoides besseyi]KAI6195409.1 MARVEL domain-containing protein [Aphelenchoides besseyi]